MSKPPGDVLRAADYTVRTVPLRTAVDLVTRHHYAKGGPNTGVFRHGLFHRDDPDACLGVAWWLPPTRRAAESVHPDWRRVVSLTRLAIAPEVPTNGATYLLGRSVRLIRATGRFAALVTWADEGQGHTGAIYRAAGWTYLGTSVGDAVWKTPEGRQVARKRGPVSRTAAEMRGLGFTSFGRTRKHKFVLMLEDVAA